MTIRDHAWWVQPIAAFCVLILMALAMSGCAPVRAVIGDVEQRCDFWRGVIAGTEGVQSVTVQAAREGLERYCDARAPLDPEPQNTFNSTTPP